MQHPFRFQTVLLCCVCLIACGSAGGADTVNLGAVSLSPGFSAGNFADIFDLTRGDLTLSYSIDMRNITQPAPWVTSYVQVGLRQVGAGNFNPGPWDTYQGGAGGWMNSLVGDLTPSPDTQSLFDKHNLGASGGRGEADYDATAPDTIIGPSGGTANHGIWFDRDGVDQWQAQHHLAVDGGTYNTGGVYDIVINYHAITPTLATMFATVNGVQQGFYTGGYNPGDPDFWPAGLSFKGDMTQMQLFYGLWAPQGVGGDVLLDGISVAAAPPVPEPMSLALAGIGLGAVARVRRRGGR